MKFLFFIQRMLASLIDLIIVYLTFAGLAIILFKSVSSVVGLLAAVIFVVYNTIAITSFNGQTVGKYFAKLQVKTQSPSLLEAGQGEFAKILYFLPFAAPLFWIISIICYILTGKFLHDWIGRREVIVHG